MDYNDGLANEVQSWSYDAAGNRVSDSAKPGSWTYDNLNRMSGSPMASYTHDAVGNRLTKVVGGNTTSYGWDAVNRMTESGPLTGSRHHYTYRADGMRVRKEIPGLVEKVYYDGQMPVETFEDFSTGSDKLTRNFVGARGLEMMETTVSGATTQAYPLYDTHGNMVATLSKDSAGTSWNLANERSYDVWGSVRSGATTGGPKGRYVANLGHVQDDESGLIYMRARYYEPESGRFVSEDRARDGKNWYLYCTNNPVNLVDHSGKQDESVQPTKNAFGWFSGFLAILLTIGSALFDRTAALVAVGGATFLIAWFTLDYRGFTIEGLGGGDFNGAFLARAITGGLNMLLFTAFAATFAPLNAGDASVGSKAIAVVTAYSGNLALFMFLESVASGEGP